MKDFTQFSHQLPSCSSYFPWPGKLKFWDHLPSHNQHSLIRVFLGFWLCFHNILIHPRWLCVCACVCGMCVSTFFFFIFTATPVAYRRSQVALWNQSYGCRPTPQPRQLGIRAASWTYTTAHGNARSLIQWVRPGIKPAFSGSNPLCHFENA